MARVIDYSVVATTLLGGGFESLYHNSGAFGFPRAVATWSVGWVGPPDPTLRPGALALVRRIAEPFGATMASLAARAWEEHLPGPVWLMPRSHWAYELDFGNREWLPDTLRRAGVEPANLAPHNDGSAVEFAHGERETFEAVLGELLGNLRGSDFALAWPGRPVACTVHHHQQLWWTSSDAEVMAALDALAPPTIPSATGGQ